MDKQTALAIADANVKSAEAHLELVEYIARLEKRVDAMWQMMEAQSTLLDALMKACGFEASE